MIQMRAPGIVGTGETAFMRRPGPACSTAGLLAQAIELALADAGLALADVDGLGVASFTLRPDRAIDLAWQLGLGLRWCMQDEMGGASAINLLRQAWLALQAGQARTIVLVAGDHFAGADFAALVQAYNTSARDYLSPLGCLGPNPLFAMLTQRQMAACGLQRDDYGALCIAQRRNAANNPNAAYRQALSLQDYLDAPLVAPPLGRLDCVPVVSGATALVLQAQPQGVSVRLLAQGAGYNLDRQEGDGLSTGIAGFAKALWAQAECLPAQMDVVGVYDDYPAMILAQMVDLGLSPAHALKDFIHRRLASGALPFNTAGGQLSAGQTGAGGGMHILAEVVRQLLGRAGPGQVAGARLGVASGYGMVQQRYGMCANAVVLGREET
ncbi:thiolase family protein [Kerstersia similis]|uniref:thiolase family protein n=1 Tax=Kerstersia similis TaxID=206505 RepID=UPI0039EFF981